MSRMDMSNDDLVQFILAALIVLGGIVVNVIQRANRWINEKRMLNRGRTQPRPVHQSQPAASPAQPSESAQAMILRELERALRGEAPPSAAPAKEGMRMQTVPPPAAPRQEPPTPPKRRPAPPAPTIARTQTAAYALRERPTLGSLAVLKDRNDVLRAVIAREIFSPPRALRPIGRGDRQV